MARNKPRLQEETSAEFFSRTFQQGEDWFWDWIEYGATHGSELQREWMLQVATREQLIEYYRYICEEVQDALAEPWNGLLTPDGDHLSEDGQKDMNYWIVSQGQTLWEIASETMMERSASNTETLEALLTELVQIYFTNQPEGTEFSWNGVTWLLRSDFYSHVGTEAMGALFEDRFEQWIEDYAWS